MNNSFIGIDPGAKGALALCMADGSGVEVHGFYTLTPRELGELILEACRGANVLLERVHSMPGQGVASTFKFGQSYGHVEMALALAGARYDYVQPSKWQRFHGLAGLKLPTKTEKKRKHKEKAQQLFPGIRVTLENCDALLIMDYLRRGAK